MSAGNAGAAIGLANTNKVLPIGGLVADTSSPTAGVTWIGDNLGGNGGPAPNQYWSYNYLGEEVNPAFQVPSCNGGGKVLSWVTSGGAPIVVPADGRMTITAGVAVAAVGAGATKYFGAAGITIPANSFFWVETFP